MFSTDESRTVDIPVACPVVDLTAGDSSPGLVESSSSSEDETDAELDEARHEAAQAQVRLLEARVRARLASRTSRFNASSASDVSRPPTPHEPVLPVAAPVTPPRATWRRGRPLQGIRNAAPESGSRYPARVSSSKSCSVCSQA